jgi:hypothetical protein
LKAAAAALPPTGLVIIDDLPPQMGSGPSAFEVWTQALDTTDKAVGNTD